MQALFSTKIVAVLGRSGWAVEEVLEDEGGGAGVEFAGFAGGDEVAAFGAGAEGFGGVAGEAFVDAVDGEAEAVFEFPDEGVDFAGFEADGVVHIVGVADDESIGAAALDLAGNVCPALIRFGLGGGRDGEGEAEFIGPGEADAFFAVVNPEETHGRFR
jgi:hypothetical protein